MRNGRRLIGVGSFFAVIAATTLWVRATDEYGFLDKYHPKRTIEMGSPMIGPPDIARRILTFTFQETTPELLTEIKGAFRQDFESQTGYIGIRAPRRKSGRHIFYDHTVNRLTVYEDRHPSWISFQWGALKQTLGTSP